MWGFMAWDLGNRDNGLFGKIRTSKELIDAIKADALKAIEPFRKSNGR